MINHRRHAEIWETISGEIKTAIDWYASSVPNRATMQWFDQRRSPQTARWDRRTLFYIFYACPFCFCCKAYLIEQLIMDDGWLWFQVVLKTTLSKCRVLRW